jgi:hypothetical protein
MNDFDQLNQWRRHVQTAADLTRAEGDLLAEKQRHDHTFQTAVNALHEIAEMDVDAHHSLGDTIRRMKQIASEAFIAIAEPEPTSAPDDCKHDDEIPPFLSKARRAKMRQIWKELTGNRQ